MQETVRRINELAAKAKSEGLTPEELAERDQLRQKYIAAIRRDLPAHDRFPDGEHLQGERGGRSRGEKLTFLYGRARECAILVPCKQVNISRGVVWMQCACLQARPLRAPRCTARRRLTS